MIDCREAYANGYRHGLQGLYRDTPYAVRRNFYYASETDWKEHNQRVTVSRMMSVAFEKGYRAGERARIILAATGGSTAFERALERSRRGRMTRVA